MKPNKPNKQEVVDALKILLKWATGSVKHGNPYCYPAVKHASEVLAREQGITDWLDVTL